MGKQISVTCDYPGCSNHGQSDTIPQGWYYLTVRSPFNVQGQPNPAVISALLCADCAARIVTVLRGQL